MGSCRKGRNLWKDSISLVAKPFCAVSEESTLGYLIKHIWATGTQYFAEIAIAFLSGILIFSSSDANTNIAIIIIVSLKIKLEALPWSFNAGIRFSSKPRGSHLIHAFHWWWGGRGKGCWWLGWWWWSWWWWGGARRRRERMKQK